MAALPPILLHLAVLVLVDPARHLGVFLLLHFLGFAWVARLVGARRYRCWQPSIAFLLGVAALLRVLLLPLPATLSDDLLRYVWDGRVTMAGENPYRHAPESPLLTPLRDELWERLPHREVATVYPPLALAVFSIAARIPASEVALKALLSLCDLLTCFLLLRLAARIGLPRRRVLLYAWNPLVTLEVAGMGHVDALGVMAAVSTVFLLYRRPVPTVGAGLAAAAGVLAKLVPVVALGVWSRASGRAPRFLLAAVVTPAVAGLAVLWWTGGVPPGLLRYGVAWDFNGPLFEPLWRAFDALGVPSGVKMLLDQAKAWTGHHEAWNRIYPFVYSQLLAKGVLALGLLAVVIRSLWDRAEPAAATGRILGGALLCTATFYPWYSLWVLPWAALCGQVAWLTLGALLPLTYLAQPGPLPLWPGLWAAVWLPFWLLLWRAPQWSTD